jgi:hypothetical protein
MALRNAPFKAGVIKDNPKFSAQGYAVDSEKIRFVNGKIESQGGWEQATTDTVSGVARNLFAWADNNASRYLAISTDRKHYAMTNQAIYNITPQRSTGTFAASPFATVSGSNVVTVTLANHGALVNDAVVIAGSSTFNGLLIGGSSGTYAANPLTTTLGSPLVLINSPNHNLSSGDEVTLGGTIPTVGGITLTAGKYLVYVLDASTLQIQGPGNATSSVAGGGGSAITYSYGHQYAVQSVIDGSTFTINASANATATGSGGGTPSYVFEINCGNVSNLGGAGFGVGGYGNYGFGSVPVNSQTNQVQVISQCQYGQNLIFNPFFGAIYTWSLNLSQRATVLTNAPAKCNWVITTPERAQMALGCTNSSGTYDPMTVRWSDVQDNTAWTAATNNLAGSLKLAEGSFIVAARNTKGGTLVWTDTALYFIAFNQNPDIVYQATLLGKGCGLLGPNAAIEQDGIAYWLTTGRIPYIYSGGVPAPMACLSQEWFAANFSPSQEWKSFAYFDSKYTAVVFHFPTLTTNETDTYLRCDLRELSDQWAGWSVGTWDRTCWIDRGIFDRPFAISSTGVVYYQEQGTGDNGAPVTRYVEYAPIIYSAQQDGDSNHVINLRRVVIDGTITAALSMTLYGRRWPNGPLQTKGPYAFTQTTSYQDIRMQARQIAIKLTSSGTADFWRVGAILADISEGPLR